MSYYGALLSSNKASSGIQDSFLEVYNLQTYHMAYYVATLYIPPLPVQGNNHCK